MATHIALLRGVNVGGRQLPMADLRAAMVALGHGDVSTYIQSGNVMFSAGAGTAATSAEGPGGSDALASELESGLAGQLGWPVRLVVRSAAELAEVVGRNPYPDEPVGKYVHGVFLPSVPGPDAADRVAQAVRAAAGIGGRDEAELVGRTLYLHTPDGFGTSELAKSLLMKRSSPLADGTARNWSTVTKLLSLLSVG
jgi:uncharacterized protein (DUF1697 family)